MWSRRDALFAKPILCGPDFFYCTNIAPGAVKPNVEVCSFHAQLLRKISDRYSALTSGAQRGNNLLLQFTAAGLLAAYPPQPRSCDRQLSGLVIAALGRLHATLHAKHLLFDLLHARHQRLFAFGKYDQLAQNRARDVPKHSLVWLRGCVMQVLGLRLTPTPSDKSYPSVSSRVLENAAAVAIDVRTRLHAIARIRIHSTGNAATRSMPVPMNFPPPETT